MSRFIGATLLLAACVCVGNSSVQADEGQSDLLQRTDPHCSRTPIARPSSTVRGQSPSYRGPTSLPRGRAYYNNRYFGNFNNRFYGPQYGYF